MGKTPLYQMTLAQIEKVRQTARAAGKEEGLLMALQISAMTLNDHFGFGPKRGERFFAEAGKLCEEYLEGRLSAKDIASTLEKEWGIRFEKRK